MAEFRIIALNGVGFTLVRHGEVLSGPVAYGLIGFEQIAIVTLPLDMSVSKVCKTAPVRSKTIRQPKMQRVPLSAKVIR